MSACPRSTSAGFWAGTGPIGTTPQRARLCRSSASSGAGSVSGGVIPSQPAASPSRPRQMVPTRRVVIVPPCSPQRERYRDLVRGGVDPLEAERAAGRHEDAASRHREISTAREKARRLHARPAGPVSDAPAVANLEIREPETEPPGGRPLDPPLVQPVPNGLDVVGLRQPVADGADHQTELQSGRLPERPQLHVPTEAQPHEPVREAETVLDGLATHRDRVASRREDRRGPIRPGVAPDRLADHVDGGPPVGSARPYTVG